MEEKRLDFNAPLLSVRRFQAPASSSSNSSRVPIKKSSLPLYKSELKSVMVGNPGVIPFLWEQTPGQPKGILKENDSDGPIAAGSIPNSSDGIWVREEEEESIYDDGLSDSLETLSRTESFFRDCSVSGHSGSPDAMEPSETFAKDPQVQDFMMGRFLPAAQAMAVGSLQSAAWKPPAVQPRESSRIAERTSDGNYRKPLPLPFQHLPNVVSRYAHDREDDESYDDDDEEEDYGGTRHLSSKACGLIPRFCLKRNLFLLNPVPGMKFRSQLPPRSGRKVDSRIRISDHGSLGNVKDEHSWEAVYKYKLGQEEYPQREDESKLTSESNRHTYWTDSQPHDGSSPYHCSTGGISPYMNEAPQLPFHEGRGFLGVPKRELKSWKTNSFDACEKIGENCWGITPNHGRHRRSSSMSPSADRTLYVDSIRIPEALNLKSSSVAATADTKEMINSADKNSEVVADSQKMEESLVLQTCERDAMQPKSSEVVEPGLSSYSETSNFKEMDDNGFRRHGSDNGQLPLKVDQEKDDASLALALLPPPLPKSPSDSWLQRTLPSMSSKNPSPQSFLAIQFQHRKQAFQASSNDLSSLTHVKPSKLTLHR